MITCVQKLTTLALAVLDISISAHYEDMKGIQNVENGVVWGS